MDFKNELYINIVLYNEHLLETSFFKKNYEKEKYNLIVIDNSSVDFYMDSNKKTCENENIIYISMQGNKGLSKAYNAGIEYLEKSNIVDYWFMTLDQDTEVSNDYIDNILSSIDSNPGIKIKTGLIEFDSGIASPNYSNGSPLQKTGIYSNVFCINSCLVLHSEILKSIKGYDDRLFLDMVDYLLFYNIYKNKNEDVEVVSGRIYQDFSGEDFSDYKKTMNRYRIFKKDFVQYCIITHKSFWYRYKTLIKRRVNILIHYRRI